MSQDLKPARAYCPSSAPHIPGATVLGVLAEAESQPAVAYTRQPTPVTDDLLRLLGDVPANQVLRIAAPCQESSCAHFRNSQCGLIAKIVRARLPEDTALPLPRCHLRPHCRWWLQEKAAACRRCPLILTDDVQASEVRMWIADPANTAEQFDPRDFRGTLSANDGQNIVTE